MSNKKCTAQSSINFAVLAAIRGSTPLMLWFAIMHLQSAGLVIAIKCALTLALFLCSTLWYFCRNDDSKLIIQKNLSNKATYWKICVIGVLQSALPYIFVSYSLQYLPPTLIGVCMVSAPWWSALFERIPLVKGTKVGGTVKVGMVFGLIGITLMLGPVVKESVSCIRTSPDISNSTNTTLLNMTTTTTEQPSASSDDLRHLYDTCKTLSELFLSIFYALMAPILWGIVAVFWKYNRKDTHIMVSSVGQNFVGCVIGIIVYFSFEYSSEHLVTTFEGSNTQMYVSTIFLGVLTGWLATLLVQHLFTSIGSKATNQVVTTIPFIVFVEDCIFVRDVITIYPWVVALEVLGVLLVTFGVFVSNMAFTSNPNLKSTRNRGTRNRGNLSDRLLDDQEGYDEDGELYDDDNTSGFYTSVVRSEYNDNEEGGEGGTDEYAHHYEPPPMVITTQNEESNNETEDEEINNIFQKEARNAKS
eukprot:TCONS_00005854-protein